MKRTFTFICGLMLYASTGNNFAATIGAANEQAVTRTITTDLGSNEPTMTVHSGTSSSHVLNVGTLADGRQYLSSLSIGDNIGFSATGASLCKMTITSPYVSSAGRFMMVKSADDFTEALGYDIYTGITNSSTAGASVLLKQGGVVGAYPLPSFFGLTTNGDYVSIASNATGLCKLTLENIRISWHGIYPTVQPYPTNSYIPASYKGTRTGIINITMTVEGANDNPITQ